MTTSNTTQELILPRSVVELYKGLIFDMDGTLVETIEPHSRAWIETGKKFGYEFDPAIMIEKTGASVQYICECMLRSVNAPLELLDKVLKEKFALGMKYCQESSYLLPAADVAKAYHGKLPIAMGTGSSHNYVNMFREKFDLDSFFDTFVTAHDVTKHKPDPETFLLCAQRFNLEPVDCLVFEDGKFGTQAALAGGMDCYNVVTNTFYVSKLGLETPAGKARFAVLEKLLQEHNIAMAYEME